MCKHQFGFHPEPRIGPNPWLQDIDYLPEKGVDYSECDVPTQLSAEIDRYKWKTPYLTSAGGIVGMSLKHWRKINGFGNNYFGWGGEERDAAIAVNLENLAASRQHLHELVVWQDDELHHRLRLGGLLYGDCAFGRTLVSLGVTLCYPYCKKNDPNVGKPGQSIHRPKKGFGRFSGKFMHSANHTKRITDRLLAQLDPAKAVSSECNFALDLLSFSCNVFVHSGPQHVARVFSEVCIFCQLWT
ncbi:bre-4 [Symbiodinium natans]|uniref:Bre-4 protein n=1 Tax=Symbiodinium natans TaxID=878477 RepID=A0A812N1T0_9DINO|nr:bre-4 [Symbiodinium natans]